MQKVSGCKVQSWAAGGFGKSLQKAAEERIKNRDSAISLISSQELFFLHKDLIIKPFANVLMLSHTYAMYPFFNEGQQKFDTAVKCKYQWSDGLTQTNVKWQANGWK